MHSQASKGCLRLEALEVRTMLSTCHVTRLTDQGIGKGFRGDLRYCINKVNTEPGPDVIDFTVTGTINLGSPLPDLASDVQIQGPGATALNVRRSTGADYRVLTVAAGVTVEVTGLTIANGQVKNDVGGGILNRGTLALDDVRVIDNSATNAGYYKEIKGGGIYNEGTLTISNSSIALNYSTNDSYIVSGTWTFAYGGGVYNAGTLTISDSALYQNRAISKGESLGDAYGGGVYNAAGSVTVVRSTLASNLADAFGWSQGGLGLGGAIGGNGELSIADSTISKNGASGGAAGDTGAGYGGALSHGGQTFITNSTITQNSAGGDCWCTPFGGISISGTTTITHSTIFGNSQGGIDVHGSLTLRNSIVQSVSGAITSSGYNLIRNSSGGSGYVPSDILDVDPLLGPLVDNGGPTLTLALLSGSPAIDSGTNQMAPEWDQRGPGFPRIVNGTIDIGAFEVQASPMPTAARPSARPDIFAMILATADLNSLT